MTQDNLETAMARLERIAEAHDAAFYPDWVDLRHTLEAGLAANAGASWAAPLQTRLEAAVQILDADAR